MYINLWQLENKQQSQGKNAEADDSHPTNFCII